MTTLSLTNPVPGTTADANVIASNNNAIIAVVNGGIDNLNFGAGKIFDNTKIMQGGATLGQGLVWNNTSWVPSSLAYQAQVTISGITNLAWNGGSAPVSMLEISAGGSTLRSIAAPQYVGQRVVFWNASGSGVVFSHQDGLATGAKLYLRGAASATINNLEAIEFVYDGVNWGEVSRNVAPVVATTYRKVTAKAVNSTVAATDLLNGEITVAAGVMGSTGMARLTAWGDVLQNSGGNAAWPRFQVAMGGTVIIDTNTPGAQAGAGATRGFWQLTCEILNTATNVQVINLRMFGMNAAGFAAAATANFSTGTGSYNIGYGASGSTMVSAWGGASSAIDTTASKVLALNTINGSASATYETKLYGALVEIV